MSGHIIPINGKTVMFIGNSFVYYGGAVSDACQFYNEDSGFFSKICKQNGEDVTVVNRTFGGHRLCDFLPEGCRFSKHQGRSDNPHGGCPGIGADLLSRIDLSAVDYVFFSEAGIQNPELVSTLERLTARFPNPETKFFYIGHSYTYLKNHTTITDAYPALREKGFGIVEWGRLVRDIIEGDAKIEGSAVEYTKDTFIVNKKDTFHPNPLSGYITALMCYCAVTGKSAVGADYGFVADAFAGNGSGGLKNAMSGFVDEYYNPGTTNYPEVFASDADMKGIQKLIDAYLGDLIVR